MQVQLKSQNSLHPTLSITLPSSNLRSSSSFSSCQPFLLLHLPSGVFFDPYTPKRVLGVQTAVDVNLLTSHLELEKGVGWSKHHNHGQAVIRQWWERPLGSDYEPESGFGSGSAAKYRDAGRAEPELLIHDPFQQAIRDAAQGFLNNKDSIASDPKDRVQGRASSASQDIERSSLLIQLNPSSSSNPLTIDVPLHSRYHPPSTSSEGTDSKGKNSLLPALESFRGLLLEILPTKLIQTLFSFLPKTLQPQASWLDHTPQSQSTPQQQQQHVQVSIAHPNYFLYCPKVSPNKVMEGYIKTTFESIFPEEHSHALETLARKQAFGGQGQVEGEGEGGLTRISPIFVPSSHISSDGIVDDSLTLSVPIPSLDHFETVHFVTLTSITLSLAWILYRLRTNISQLTRAEQSWLENEKVQLQQENK